MKKWATKSFKLGFIVMQFGCCKLPVFVCFSYVSICKAKLSEVWEKHIQQLVDLEVGFLMWKMTDRFLTCDVNAVSIGLACFVVIRVLCKFLAAYTSLTGHKSSSTMLSVCFLFPIYPGREEHFEWGEWENLQACINLKNAVLLSYGRNLICSF